MKITSILLIITIVLLTMAGCIKPPPPSEEQIQMQAMLTETIDTYINREDELLISFVEGTDWKSAMSTLRNLQKNKNLTAADIEETSVKLDALLEGENQDAIFAKTGDVNRDGVVNGADAQLVEQYLAGTTTLKEKSLLRANVSGNYEKELSDWEGFPIRVNGAPIVESVDVQLILQYEAGEISVFPADLWAFDLADFLFNFRATFSELRNTSYEFKSRYGIPMYNDLFDCYRDIDRLIENSSLIEEAEKPTPDNTILAPLEEPLRDVLTLYAQMGLIDEPSWSALWIYLEGYGVNKAVAYPEAREPWMPTHFDELELNYEQFYREEISDVLAEYYDEEVTLIFYTAFRNLVEESRKDQDILDALWLEEEEFWELDADILRRFMEVYEPYFTTQAMMLYVDKARWNSFWDKMIPIVGGEKPEYPAPRAETPLPRQIPVIGGFAMLNDSLAGN